MGSRFSCSVLADLLLRVRSRARPPWAVPFLFLRELCFFFNRPISRRGTSPFFSQMSLNLASEICHLLCGGEDDLRQSRSSSSVDSQVVQLISSICIKKIVRSTLRD